MSTVENDLNLKFCDEMRIATKSFHDQSDKLINLKLAVVLTDTKLWAEAVADFYFVYMSIEKALEQHPEHVCVKPLIVPELVRTKAFEEDLEFYLGEHWASKINPSKPCKEYCDRIIDVSHTDPVLLIAYAHSMYLALLAGGQIIRKVVKKTLGLQSEEGLAIFDFRGVNKTEIRRRLVDGINNLNLDQTKKDEIIKEKKRVFQMNNAIANNIEPTFKSYSRLLKLIFILISILILFIFFAYVVTKRIWL